MNETDARRLLLVRAVETEDQSEALLTREDRQQATSFALGEGRSGGSGTSGPDRRRTDENFLARRSQFAFGRLATRFPAVAQACRAAHWPPWLNWLLPLVALLIGLATNEIDSGQRLNIIAFPLVGMIAWNLAVYGLLAAAFVGRLARGRGPARPGFLARLAERAAAPARSRLDGQQPLGHALARFARDWAHHSARLTRARASRTLHLSAAALAAGVLMSMYLRALGLEYRAGWESTFIGPHGLQAILSLVLGPASALTGIPLPGLEQLEALRWTERSRGENAGPWIHLYATTAFLFIIGPRLLLSLWSAARAHRLRRQFPVPGRDDFYVRRLLRNAAGSGAEVRIIPYSFHPPDGGRRALQRLLSDVLGDGTRTTIEAPIAYGTEDEWLSRAAFSPDTDYLVLLFNLSATPEAENHGAFVAGIKRRLAEGGTGLAALLDESAYRQRLAGQAGAEARIETRRAAWEKVLGQHGVRPLSIDLEAGDAPNLVQRLEGALMQTSNLMPAGSAA